MKPDCAEPEYPCLIPDWCAEYGCARMVPKRMITDTQIDGAISVLREWFNTGADGESAHLLCDAVLQLRATVQAHQKAAVCPECGSANISEAPTTETYPFLDTELVYLFPACRCAACGFGWTDWRKEDAEILARYKFLIGKYQGQLAELEQLRKRPEDNPENDATDAAHPAWWRGHDSGGTGVALALIKVAVAGKTEGTFASSEVELAAGAIQDLRARLHIAETTRDELSDALDRERLQHDETHSYRHQAELDLELCRQGYRALDANWEKHHETCMVPIRAALGRPDATISEIIIRIQHLRRAAGET